MDNSVLIGTKTEFCPICDKIHEIEERKERKEVRVHGIKVQYDKYFLRCNLSNDEYTDYTPGFMIRENLARIRKAYNNLL